MSSWVPVHILTTPCFILGPRTRLNCRHFTNCFINSLATKSHTFSHHQIRAWKPDVDTVVSDNAKYGGKQIISVTPRLYDYILGNVREPEILRELREETATMRGSQMQVSPDQAQLLAMLVQVQGAKRCIEVGIYTGYSSLAIALVLPEQGRLVACERDEKSIEVAKRYYDRAGVSGKVDVRHGIAADTLRSMIQNGEGCSPQPSPSTVSALGISPLTSRSRQSSARRSSSQVSLTPRSSSQISRNVTGSSSEIHSLSALSPKRRRLASRRHALKSPLSRQAVKLSSQASPAQFFELCD